MVSKSMHRERVAFGRRSVMKIDGGCHCGYIAYEAEADPAKAIICHCTDCQTLSGSAFRTVLPTQKGSFKLRSGELKIYVKTAESGTCGCYACDGVQRPRAKPWSSSVGRPTADLRRCRRRTFSIAIAAWSAKVDANSICFAVNGRTSERVKLSTPIATPSRSMGTARAVR